MSWIFEGVRRKVRIARNQELHGSPQLSPSNQNGCGTVPFANSWIAVDGAREFNRWATCMKIKLSATNAID